MTNFFSKLRGARSTYVSDDDGMLVESRDIICICHFGEDPDKCIDAFWREHPDAAPFLLIPQFAYGNAPRKELCTQKSLVAALQTAVIEPGSHMELKWKEVCKFHNVAWPKRLTAAA